MQVILLQRVEKLGAMGDVVKVKDGFARNFLIPQGKALRASKDNVTYFEAQKAVLQTQNDQRRKDAETVSQKLNGLKIILIRQASEAGHLFGSVSPRDIVEALAEKGFTVTRQQVRLNQAIKELGILNVAVELHPEVVVQIGVNIARSEDEAKAQETEASAPKEKTKAKKAISGEEEQPDYEPPPEAAAEGSEEAAA